MERLVRHISISILCILLAGCESPRLQDQVAYGIAIMGQQTRSIADDILSAAGGPISIAITDYPERIDVRCSDGNTFVLERTGAICDTHTEKAYLQYKATGLTSPYVIERIGEKTFSAKAVVDGGDTLVCSEARLEEGHLLFDLQHTRALVRIGMQTVARYDKIRSIYVDSVACDGKAIDYLANSVLSTTMQYIGYCYVAPIAISEMSGTHRLTCRYTVYDQDANETEHATRRDVMKTNAYAWNKLTAGGQPVTEIEAGHYYDLCITINPDSLFVLSDHDNK